MQLDCAGKILDLSQPCVMGILNVTPDSYSEVGRVQGCDQALRLAEQMVAEGAAIIDIGGEPTNPSLHPVVPLQEELDRVMPVLEQLCKVLPVPISIDTSKPEVMREAINVGVGLINDVRALRYEGALEIVAQAQVSVCLMHMAYPDGVPQKGTPATAPEDEEDIVADVEVFLMQRLMACQQAGIGRERIILDPGVGAGNFGKTTQQSLSLIKQLKSLQGFHLPILVGASRKTFIGDYLDLPVAQRLPASLAIATIAVMNGAAIIRAHDVKATVEAVKITQGVLAAE